MYSIYCDGDLMYKDSAQSPELKVLDCVLTLKENAAGSLEATLPPINKAYNDIDRMKSTISVYRDGSEYWRGRVISDSTNFLNQKKITCEGAFAFFNDIQIEPLEFSGRVEDALPMLLTKYNQHVSSSRYIYNGTCTVDNGVEIYTEEYMSMYDILKTYFIDQFNGGFKISFRNGNMYLDYLATGGDGTQSIIFGENLLDFTKSFDMTDVITVLIPLGPEDEETGERMTIEEVGTSGIYYEMTDMIRKYGRIEQVQIFDDAEDEYDLLAKAEEYMTAVQYEELVLEVSAVDLHYLDNTVNRFDLYQRIHCISKPHGLDNWYPVCEMHLDLTRPENCKYVLGPSKEKHISGKINKMIDAAVDNKVPTEVQHAISQIDWPEIETDIVEHKVIKAETMMATFCFTKYMLVQFMETNFEAIDASGENPQRTHSSRNYIRIYDEKIYFFEDELTDDIVGYQFFGKPLYWTAISGDRAFQYFTFESPDKISPDKRPSGITDEEFRAMYQVKIWATATNGHHEKGYMGFAEFAGSGSTTIKEPVIKLGVGDGNGYGTAMIYKSQNGLDVYYNSRTEQIPIGLRFKDDGYYAIIDDLERKFAPPLLYASIADAQADVGTIPPYMAAALIEPSYDPTGGGS